MGVGLDQSLRRCPWAMRSEPEAIYHDLEWGIPEHEDRKLFELLVLEGAQAGLSWLTVLRKREAYRHALDHFDPHRIATYDQNQIARLMNNPALIRNRAKLNSVVQNARSFIAVQERHGSFDAFLWSFAEGEPKIQVWGSQADLPSKSPVSEALSRSLKRFGFTFVGPIICYSYMQATGLVNDHIEGCYKISAG